ncbi:MAG: DUF2087 domain-containing protein [Agrococcus casei]|uniref:DUF2087 domain-containing protein n=1 Tax=Agrococcus casei TaxID=343512 RepID=UPI003F910A9A
MPEAAAREGRIRQLLATLADTGRRRMFARLVLADDGIETDALSTREHRHLDALVRAGLAELDGDRARASDGFSPLLTKKQAATGMDRFVRDGRIETWPAKPDDRTAVMRWAAERALQPGEQVDEQTVTERLGALWRDPATLRRDLVDNGLLERAADGSSYWLA